MKCLAKSCDCCGSNFYFTKDGKRGVVFGEKGLCNECLAEIKEVYYEYKHGKIGEGVFKNALEKFAKNTGIHLGCLLSFILKHT